MVDCLSASATVIRSRVFFLSSPDRDTISLPRIVSLSFYVSISLYCTEESRKMVPPLRSRNVLPLSTYASQALADVSLVRSSSEVCGQSLFCVAWLNIAIAAHALDHEHHETFPRSKNQPRLPSRPLVRALHFPQRFLTHALRRSLHSPFTIH